MNLEKLIIADVKKMNLKDVYNIYPNSITYYEGNQKLKLKTYNRFNIVEGSNLLLLSVPPSINDLLELIKKTQASNLLLFFKDDFKKTIREIIVDFLKIVKFVMNKKSGKIKIEQLASFFNQDLSTTLLSLYYLKDINLIRFNVEKDMVFIENSEEKIKKSSANIKKNLKTKLKEGIAFKKFLLDLNSSKIRELLKEENL